MTRRPIVRPTLRRAAAALALAALPLVSACERSPTGQGGLGEVAVILNSVENSLTVAPVEGFGTPSTIGLGGASASPVTLALRGRTAVVPLGTYPFAAVVDVAAGTVPHTVPLPEGSGATGVAFLNDSIAVVANPALNSVTPVNVRRGTAGAQVPVGVYPHSIVEAGGRLFVLNAQLENWAPARNGTITVLDGALQTVGTVQLGGLNPQRAVAAGNTLYVIHAGTFGGGNGSLSVVSLATLTETHHAAGFGEFPGSVAVGPEGHVYVGSYGGIAVWNPATRTFVHAPASPLVGGPAVDVAFDSRGRLHAVAPGDCTASPGGLFRFSSAGQVERGVFAGVCSYAVAFTALPRG